MRKLTKKDIQREVLAAIQITKSNLILNAKKPREITVDDLLLALGVVDFYPFTETMVNIIEKDGLSWDEIIGVFNNIGDAGIPNEKTSEERLNDLIKTYSLPDNVLECIVSNVEKIRKRGCEQK